MTIRGVLLAAASVAALAGAGPASEWSEPAEVRHEEKTCVTYRARWNGEYLMVQAALEPGWHTFAMDNKKRQQEKLKGKPSLGIERETEIRVTGGLAPSGPWRQTAPKDFSKPEMRWYSWGFEEPALFAVKAHRTGPGAAAARIEVLGQACTETTCKNIDVFLTLPLRAAAKPAGAPAEMDALVPVR